MRKQRRGEVLAWPVTVIRIGVYGKQKLPIESRGSACVSSKTSKIFILNRVRKVASIFDWWTQCEEGGSSRPGVLLPHCLLQLFIFSSPASSATARNLHPTTKPRPFRVKRPKISQKMSTDERFSTADWVKAETNAEDGAEWSGLGGNDTVPVDTDDMDLDIAGGEHERDQSSDNGKGKGKEKILKPLTPEALAAFEAAQKRAGIIYISRIPPGMRPQKLRHIMSGYGEVGRIYMAFEGKRWHF